jgi:hypothetical protein
MENKRGPYFVLGFASLLLGLSLVAMGGHDLARAAYSPETGFHPQRGKILLVVGLAMFGGTLWSFSRLRRS